LGGAGADFDCEVEAVLLVRICLRLMPLAPSPASSVAADALGVALFQIEVSFQMLELPVVSSAAFCAFSSAAFRAFCAAFTSAGGRFLLSDFSADASSVLDI
jgi:hypothetical protein